MGSPPIDEVANSASCRKRLGVQAHLFSVEFLIDCSTPACIGSDLEGEDSECKKDHCWVN